MQDRIPLYPGRVTLTPVSGMENTYTLTRADQPTQEGTPLNKASLLSDSSAEAYGLAPESSTPNDAFALLSRFNSGLGNDYIWSKNTEHVEAVVSSATSNVFFGGSQSGGDTADMNEVITVLIYPNIAKSGDSFVLSGQSVSFAYSYNSIGSNTVSLSSYAGYYLQNGTNFYQIQANSDISRDYQSSSGGYGLSFRNTKQVDDVVTRYTVVGYVNSSNESSFPPANPDGYTYLLLGKLGGFCKIQTVSYIGTGTYGESNPTTVTFNAPPSVVLMFYEGKVTGYVWGDTKLTGSGVNTVSVNGYTMSWFTISQSAQNQFNSQGEAYTVIGLS